MFTIDRMIPENDLDAILDIETESFTSPWTREMFMWEANNSDVSHVYVLRTEGIVVAFCSCWLIFDELHINNIAVRTAFRRRGFANALVDHVLFEAARLGALRATLEVRRSNAAALQLYEQNGFVVKGVRRNYYTKPDEDALVLWRRHTG